MIIKSLIIQNEYSIVAVYTVGDHDQEKLENQDSSQSAKRPYARVAFLDPVNL